MTRSSTKQIPAFKVARDKQKPVFVQKLKKLGYRLCNSQSKIIEIVENSFTKPKRATVENVLQKQYRYVSVNGYQVYIHTGMIGDDFASTGAGWLHILDRKGQRKISWLFPRSLGHTLMFHIGAYAELAKIIVDSMSKDAEIVESSHLNFFITNPGDYKKIDFLQLAEKLNKAEASYVKTREKRSEKYVNAHIALEAEGKHCWRRNRRKKWNKGN